MHIRADMTMLLARSFTHNRIFFAKFEICKSKKPANEQTFAG